MNFVSLVVFVALFSVTDGGNSAPISVSSGKLTMNGNSNVHVQLHSTMEEIWTALSTAHRYPIIKSGDLIVLLSAQTSGKFWKEYINCLSGSFCYFTNGCRSVLGTVMTPSAWSSCPSKMMFTISARGKTDGQPIDSGDKVSLKAYGSNYRMRCDKSLNKPCTMQSIKSPMTGDSWLHYSYATFEIYSRNAVDGTPVQYGDVVGFKFPYSSYNTWLSIGSSFGGYLKPRSCSSDNKMSCAKENTWTGFKIFKKL